MQIGDSIVIEAERTTQRPRAGVIEEVLEESPARLRVRWEDGHTSIVCPSSGAARIEPQAAEKPKRRARST